jgi:hypothetical protein
MELTFSTPALLFPAVSLLFISYTNRFINYAQLVRRLNERWRDDPSSVLREQIRNLRRRIYLIRNMQIAGAASLLACVVSMLLLFFEYLIAAEVAFAIALVAMLLSLLLLVIEVSISVRALDLQLNDMED